MYHFIVSRCWCCCAAPTIATILATLYKFNEIVLWFSFKFSHLSSFDHFFFQFPEDEQLTDGQKKAEKIKASFENPFKKVGCKIKLNLVARVLSLSLSCSLWRTSVIGPCMGMRLKFKALLMHSNLRSYTVEKVQSLDKRVWVVSHVGERKKDLDISLVWRTCAMSELRVLAPLTDFYPCFTAMTKL